MMLFGDVYRWERWERWSDTEHHMLDQNSILSRVKTTPIYLVIREKNQRFEVIRGEHGIDQ
jgi:hypothetical protein